MTVRERPPDKEELIRRLRLGDVRRLLRARYGPVLPNDDAGREDLRELLLLHSLALTEPALKMKNAAEVHAPWMTEEEVRALMDDIQRTPVSKRKRTGADLGQIMGLVNHERERLKLWTITPIDMSAERLAEFRKFKRLMRERLRRQKAGCALRDVYLANSISSHKPWEAQGISRATWYRRRETSVWPTKLNKQAVELSHIRAGSPGGKRHEALPEKQKNRRRIGSLRWLPRSRAIDMDLSHVDSGGGETRTTRWSS